MRYRPPHQQLGAQIAATAALITQKVSVGLFFLLLLLLLPFAFSARHTKAETRVIVVKTFNAFAGDSTVYYFYDEPLKRKGTKGDRAGLSLLGPRPKQSTRP